MGTATGGNVRLSGVRAANGSNPFSLNAIVQSLTIGTTYWIDVSLIAITGGTASIKNLSVSIIEL
jgi:hypothetical protein